MTKTTGRDWSQCRHRGQCRRDVCLHELEPGQGVLKQLAPGRRMHQDLAQLAVVEASAAPRVAIDGRKRAATYSWVNRLDVVSSQAPQRGL